MKCSLGISIIFLKRSLVFPILLFSFISLHWSLRKAFISLLAIFWNSAFKWVYLSFSPLPFTSLFFSAICKVSSDYLFAFLHFFFLIMVLVTASLTVLQTSIHSSSGTLSVLIPWIYLSLLLYNHKGFNLGHTWKVDYILCSWKWRSSIQTGETRPEADYGSDHELFIAKFRLW